MIVQSVWQKSFDFFGKPVVVKPSGARLSSDAGLLPIRQFDEAIGLTEQFIDALSDRRYQPSVVHGFGEMVRSRIYGILADYPDQNDHDVLRSDPVFKLVAGRSPDDSDLASQPTLSRFEKKPAIDSICRRKGREKAEKMRPARANRRLHFKVTRFRPFFRRHCWTSSNPSNVRRLLTAGPED